ncbi:hypothetical protein V6N12_011662 [Hibiscus sabdariffa]|uniref:Uncharacterized protein n=1 Tax=Hibiscus sabdariffa TaxID=183260 RepID=A0ABR2B5T2_9ROSI
MDPPGDRSISHCLTHAQADSMPSLIRPLRCWAPQIHGPASMPDSVDEGEKSGSFGVQAQFLGLSENDCNVVSPFVWSLFLVWEASLLFPMYGKSLSGKGKKEKKRSTS